MLNISSITDCVIHSDAWFEGRLSRLTASEWYNFMGDKLRTVGAVSYIYRKVGETLSGIPSRKEISTAATEHGLQYEPDNLRKFMEVMGIEFLVTQKLITAKDSRFGCTPDGLIVISGSLDGLSYQVQTVEAKCPGYEEYIRLARCKDALEVKSVAKDKFWQVCSQMDQCGALIGWLSIYQPFFKTGGHKIIKFNKMELVDDFKLLAQRKIEAVKLFDEVHDYFLNLPAYDGQPLNLKKLIA